MFDNFTEQRQGTVKRCGIAWFSHALNTLHAAVLT